jgi:hypothetical protein
MIELYKQAQEFAYKNISKEYWNTDNFHAVVSGKFAELIVEECAKIIEAQDCDPSFKNRLSWAMKDKFGVDIK